MKQSKYKNDIMTRERAIKHKIRHFNHMFNKVLHDRLAETEIFAGESRLLMLISHHEDISQKALAKKMGTSAASVGVSLKKLEAKEYIIRKTDEKDARANKIVLTKKGDDFMESTHELFQTLDKETFNNFSDQEMGQLDALMDKLYENLSQLLQGEK